MLLLFFLHFYIIVPSTFTVECRFLAAKPNDLQHLASKNVPAIILWTFHTYFSEQYCYSSIVGFFFFNGFKSVIQISHVHPTYYKFALAI